MTYAQEQNLLVETIKMFRGQFGLRAFPQGVFIVEPSACYIKHGLAGEPIVVLYTYRRCTNADGTFEWVSFCKGTADELRAQMTKAPTEKAEVKS